jgi:hypothetical protein
VSLSLLSPCVLFSVARICIAIPSLFGAHRPGTQNDLALFSLSDTAGRVFPIQQNRSEAFRMFRPHMTLRKKMRSPHPATVAPLGPGEAKRDNVFLLPAGRWRHHSICMLCMLCDIRRCVSLAQPHVVHPLHVGTNTPAHLGMPCFAITCLRASAVVARDIPSDWRFSRSFKHAN